MPRLLIDGEWRGETHRGKNFDYWDARDWADAASAVKPDWKCFHVGWEDNLMCGMIKNA